MGVSKDDAPTWTGNGTFLGSLNVKGNTVLEGTLTLDGGLVRQPLAADRNYYVRTNGNDSNTGLANTAGGAFLTIQKAIDTAVSLDGSIFNVTINVADGTYTGSAIVKSYIGSGAWTILGNTATPALCIISTTSASCLTNPPAGCVQGVWTVKGFTLQTTTAGNCIFLFGPPTVVNFFNIEFGACAGDHINVSLQAQGSFGTGYTVSGGSAAHIRLNTGAVFTCRFQTITISGSPTITNWIVTTNVAGALIDNNTYSGAPAAGTKKYDATVNSWINTAGGVLPGTVAGTTATGGTYV